MPIIINPGSGPVDNADEKHAIENIKHYIADSNLENIKWVRIQESDSEGRYTFLLYENSGDKGVHHFIDMPGLPLDKVRFMGEATQNPFDFPRLYVDGSSWLWVYSLLEQKQFRTEDQE